MRFSVRAILMVLACACGEPPQTRPPTEARPDAGPDAADDSFVVDRDDDGLCDATEAELGTDPEQRDTDADGIPDLLELGNGFDATDSARPAPDQIAHLVAKPGSTLEFPVRITIDGQGEGVVGQFVEQGSFYADLSSARDFFRGALAVAADPVDGVRRIDSESARFRSVLGRTRLEFSLRFVYPLDDALPCARAYPFSYTLESDSGELLSDRLFLLVVSPGNATAKVDDYCIPADCQ